MKTMLKKTLACALLLTVIVPFAPQTALAQPPGGGGPGGRSGPGRPGAVMPPLTVLEAPLPLLSYGLNLSTEQADQIAAVQKAWHEFLRSNRPGRGGGSPDDLREKAKPYIQKIEAVLDDAQKQALPHLLQTLDALRITGIPLEVYPDLNLSDEQKHSIREIAKEAQEKAHQKMEEARQSGDFRGLREALEAIREEAHEQAMDVLTEAQQEIIEKFKESHPPHEGGKGRGPGGGRPPQA